MKRYVNLVRAVAFVTALTMLSTCAFAAKSPEGKPIKPSKEGTQETPSYPAPALPEPPASSGVLPSPSSGGVLGASREKDYVEGEGTKVPDDVFDPDTKTVDWERLGEYNPDIYAWIYIPSTNVDYPLVQNSSIGHLEKYEDQLYYASHDFYGNEQAAGAIFTQYPSDLKFDDRVNFIYGNNVIDGSMFQNLHMFMQDVDTDDLHLPEWKEDSLLSRPIGDDGLRTLRKSDLTGYLIIPERTIKFRIYAAYYWSDEHLQFYIDNGVLKQRYTTDEEIAEYIRSTLNPNSMQSVFYEPEDLDIDPETSTIYTLSTSISNMPSNRLLIQAVYVCDEPVSMFKWDLETETETESE